MQKIEILNGNELLIQGGLEAGFSLYTGYPGSPLADFFNILHHKKNLLEEKGARVVIANSEANAGAMASGAKMAGQDCLVAMKSMGLHVAADSLSVGNFADPGDEFLDKSLKGGVVIAVGDDPWSISTSTPADSRYLFKHLHIPFLEPATPQELKDWMKLALHLSRETSVYCGVLLTTFMAEGGGSVELHPETPPKRPKVEMDPANFDLSRHVMVPPNSLAADKRMIEERFPRVLTWLEENKLDQLYGHSESKIGFISSGLVFEMLKHVFESEDWLEIYSLYKVACSYPLIPAHLVEYLRGLDVLVVVEEKRGFLESELKQLCVSEQIELKILGKNFGDNEGYPAHGGLDYEIIREKTVQALKFLEKKAELKSVPEIKNLEVPRRLPTFCPGCPHRETLSLLKDLRQVLEKKGMKLLSHGDVGCYSLAFLEPFYEMHDLSAMGQGGALAAGSDLFAENPSIVLMGDSTFFHSGISAISNSVQCEHQITYILLDNDNTAMTGHQMTPRTGLSVEGHIRPKQDMLKTVKALGVTDAIEVNPSDRYFYKNLLQDYVLRKGTKVIISNKECALTFHARKKKQERDLFNSDQVLKEKQFYQINTDACEDCRVCVEATGCPGLTQTQDAYGTKVAIDPQICVADSYCTKLKACPSFEVVSVKNYHPYKYQTERVTNELQVPLPIGTLTPESITAGVDFRAVVIGVGGSGVTTISRVMAEAAKQMTREHSLHFKFVDQKGLAQRNGSVMGHLSLFKNGRSHVPITPKGSAELILSPDLLEGSRALNFLAPTGHLIVDSEYQIPLSILLDWGEEGEPLSEKNLYIQLVERLKDRVHAFPFKKISYQRFGKSVYASSMIIGAAFQLGKLPFDFEALVSAFEAAIAEAELTNNLQAFAIGRDLIRSGVSGYVEETNSDEEETQLARYGQSLMESSAPWESAGSLAHQFEQYLMNLGHEFPFFEKLHLAQYVHDILLYDRGRHFKDFLRKSKQLKAHFEDRSLLKMALRVLAKTYWIKDEVYVSHLMISTLKRKRDKNRYQHLGTGYEVKHINRPSFDVGGRKVEFDMSPTHGMFRVMRHCRFLRWVLPQWHAQERKLAIQIRKQLFEVSNDSFEVAYTSLKRLENIKGYRDVRYAKAKKVLEGV